MEIDRLFDAGKQILNTPMIAGGYTYLLSGDLIGTEIFGRDIFTTKIFDKPIPTEQEIRTNGSITKYPTGTFASAGSFDVTGGFGIFAGLDQPFTLWNSLTVKGIDNIYDLEKLSKILNDSEVEHELTLLDYRDQNKNFVLVLKESKYRFLATPAPYVNGVDIHVLTKENIAPMKKDRKF